MQRNTFFLHKDYYNNNNARKIDGDYDNNTTTNGLNRYKTNINDTKNYCLEDLLTDFDIKNNKKKHFSINKNQQAIVITEPFKYVDINFTHKTRMKETKYSKGRMVFTTNSFSEPVEGEIIKVEKKGKKISKEKMKYIESCIEIKDGKIHFKKKINDNELRTLTYLLCPDVMYYFIPKQTTNSKKQLSDQVIPMTEFQFEALQNGYQCDINKETLHINNIFSGKDIKKDYSNIRNQIIDCAMKNFPYQHPYGWTNSFIPDNYGKEYKFTIHRNGRSMPVVSRVFNNLLNCGYQNGKHKYLNPLAKYINICKKEAKKNKTIQLLNFPISIVNRHHAIAITFAIYPNGNIRCTLTNSNGIDKELSKKVYFQPLINDLKKSFKQYNIDDVSFYTNETRDQYDFGDCMQQSLTLSNRIAKDPLYNRTNGIKHQYEVSQKAFNRMLRKSIYDTYLMQFGYSKEQDLSKADCKIVSKQFGKNDFASEILNRNIYYNTNKSYTNKTLHNTKPITKKINRNFIISKKQSYKDIYERNNINKKPIITKNKKNIVKQKRQFIKKNFIKQNNYNAKDNSKTYYNKIFYKTI